MKHKKHKKPQKTSRHQKRVELFKNTPRVAAELIQKKILSTINRQCTEDRKFTKLLPETVVVLFDVGTLTNMIKSVEERTYCDIDRNKFLELIFNCLRSTDRVDMLVSTSAQLLDDFEHMDHLIKNKDWIEPSQGSALDEYLGDIFVYIVKSFYHRLATLGYYNSKGVLTLYFKGFQSTNTVVLVHAKSLISEKILYSDKLCKEFGNDTAL